MTEAVIIWMKFIHKTYRNMFFKIMFRVSQYDMGWVMEVQLSYYPVLLPTDSKTR